MVILVQNRNVTINIFILVRYDTLIEKITSYISNLGHIYQGLNMTAKNHLIKGDINESDIGKYNQQYQ